MIESFKQKELEKFYRTGEGKIPQFAYRRRVAMILDLLNAVTAPEQMNFPGSGFHKLQPPTANRYAVSVSGNWRICFAFREGRVFGVEYIDYH